MSRICVLVTVSPWWNHRQFHKQVPALVEGGHEVIFMAENPGADVAHGFQYDIIPKWLLRLVRLTGGISVFKRILNHQPDLCLLCCVEQLPLGLILKLFTRIKVVFDYRETFFLTFRDHRERWPKWLRYPFAYFIKGLEYVADRLFDGLVASDPNIYKAHYAMPSDRKIIFYNCPLLSQFSSSYPSLKDRPYDIVFMGSMAQQSIDTVVKAVSMLKTRGRIIKTMLLGLPYPQVLKFLERRIDELGIQDHVNVTGIIPYNQIPSLLSQAKIGLVPLRDRPKLRQNIATKTFEYMACGMPSICSDLPTQRSFIKEGKNGLFFKPNDAEELASAIISLLDDLPKAEEMGMRARRDVEKTWNCELQQKKLQKLCAEILARKSR